MDIQDMVGLDLGFGPTRYEATDAALYALAVGARAEQLELVYERDLRPLPTYATALGLWATEMAAAEAGYGPDEVLHVGQTLQVKEPLPSAADVEMSGQVAAVYDKGKAAVLDIRVDSTYFEVGYLMFVRGRGGWGGNRGPAAAPVPKTGLWPSAEVEVSENAAALYRLTGDRQPVHIDPEVARSAGFPGPLLHGLCSLGMTVRVAAEALGDSALDVRGLEMQLRAPVFPGDTINVSLGQDADTAASIVRASVGGTSVLTGTLELGTSEGGV